MRSKILGKVLRNLDMILMGILLMNIFVWMSINVFRRFVLRDSLSWSDEFCSTCFVWMMLIAFEYNVRTRNNVSMTFVYKKLSRIIQVIVSCVTNLIAAGVLAVVLPSTVELTKMHTKVVTPALQLPRVYITGVALICFVLTIVMLVLDCVKLIREYRQEV